MEIVPVDVHSVVLCTLVVSQLFPMYELPGIYHMKVGEKTCLVFQMAGSLSWQRCTTVQPASLAKLPELWTKDEVGVWLRWCTEEYSIDPIPIDKFDLNGKALCLLSRSDFMERVPKNGDVLFNSLQSLISKHGGTMLYHSGITTGTDWMTPFKDPHKTTVTTPNALSDASSARYLLMESSSSLSSTVGKPLSPNVHCLPRCSNYVPIQPHRYISVFTKHEDNHDLSTMAGPTSNHIGSSAFARPSSASEDMRSEHLNIDVLRHDRTSDCRLLWEFIYQLLCNPKFRSLVCWEDKEEYVFRIINPTGLAELWGQQKNRTNMTYEKLSRALRYYYRMNIIKKVAGKRLTYRFLQPPTTIQKGQRGAKPHYKLHLDSANVSRTERDSPVASYSGCSPCKGSVKDDSSNTSTCETNLEDVEEDEDNGSGASHNSELEAWVERSKEEQTVTSEVTRVDEHVISTSLPSHTSSIYSFPQSPHLINRMVYSDYQMNTGLSGMDYHRNRPELRLRDPFLNTPSTSHLGPFHPLMYPGRDRSTLSSNTDLHNEYKETTEHQTDQYLHENVRKNLSRSHSYDFAQSFQTQPYSFRPNMAHASNLKSEFHMEPEDLSLKSRSRSDSHSSATKVSPVRLKEEEESLEASNS